jgi:hypothetical protein
MNNDNKKVPDSVLPGLRDEWMRALGASQSAEAAREMAQRMFTAYQQRLTTVLEMLGLDPKERWYVDFRTGEITDKDPTADQTNGAAQPDAIPLGN